MDSLSQHPHLSERQVNSPASELSFHIIEAGAKGKPLILLIHGFPEIAYSWRKVMPGLADAGFYVVAVDQRGYGKTTGWDTSKFEHVDLSSFSVTNLIRDMVVLVHAIGYHQVDCIVGHDFGSVTASLCALVRPDFFRKVILISHPVKGSPKLPFDVFPSQPDSSQPQKDIHYELANLPEPRKHYKWYYSTPEASREMNPPEGLHEFLRGYFYLKSADWPGNKPQPLTSWTATELSKMPYYYIMPFECGMRDVVSEGISDVDPALLYQQSSRWLPDSELAHYVSEYSRTGFQGGLNWYRIHTNPSMLRDLDMFAGKKIEVPCMFISGSKDWGTYQEPEVIENMRNVCLDFHGSILIDGAGHWVQQEQAEEVTKRIIAFAKWAGLRT